jgi:hypothetical protein
MGGRVSKKITQSCWSRGEAGTCFIDHRRMKGRLGLNNYEYISCEGITRKPRVLARTQTRNTAGPDQSGVLTIEPIRLTQPGYTRKELSPTHNIPVIRSTLYEIEINRRPKRLYSLFDVQHCLIQFVLWVWASRGCTNQPTDGRSLNGSRNRMLQHHQCNAPVYYTRTVV